MPSVPSTSSTILRLYNHPLSSFCRKVLIALYENNIGFDRRIINFGYEKDQAELKAMWPFNKLPVIRNLARERDVAEFTVTIQYLDHFFAGERPFLDNFPPTTQQMKTSSESISRGAA